MVERLFGAEFESLAGWNATFTLLAHTYTYVLSFEASFISRKLSINETIT